MISTVPPVVVAALGGALVVGATAGTFALFALGGRDHHPHTQHTSESRTEPAVRSGDG